MENRGVRAPKIALFRARADAARSAARLRRLGFAVACLPVIEIAPLSFTPKRTRYDAVVATSANAFLGEPPVVASSPLYVVGARTARAAEARGWRMAAPPAADAERLVETLKRRIAPGANLLYLAGRDRKPSLEAALDGFCALEVVEAYAAEARKAWRPVEARALASSVVALHYSRRSAALAAQLAESAGAAAHFASMRHVCLSNDVAEPLRAIGAAQVLVADQPKESALFATLSEASSIFPSDRASRI
jgi:uroporphyrinogen-III synthase